MKHTLVDIHRHSLFGIDDGADDMEMSLKMLRMAEEQGVKTVFCTSHSYYMLNAHGEIEKHYLQNFHILQEKVKKEDEPEKIHTSDRHVHDI